jgi:hypothetical protein
MKVVPVTIGALALTNDTLASLTWRDPARPDAWSAPSMMCQRPWMRPVPRLPPKVLSGNSPEVRAGGSRDQPAIVDQLWPPASGSVPPWAERRGHILIANSQMRGYK